MATQKLIQMLSNKEDVLLQGGAALVIFEGAMAAWAQDDFIIKGLSIKCPRHEGDEYFMVVRVERGGEHLVAFRSGGSLLEVLVGLVRALQYGKLKLREDKYEERDS